MRIPNPQFMRDIPPAMPVSRRGIVPAPIRHSCPATCAAEQSAACRDPRSPSASVAARRHDSPTRRKFCVETASGSWIGAAEKPHTKDDWLRRIILSGARHRASPRVFRWMYLVKMRGADQATNLRKFNRCSLTQRANSGRAKTPWEQAFGFIAFSVTAIELGHLKHIIKNILLQRMCAPESRCHRVVTIGER